MANDGQIVFEVTADGKHAIADIKDITRAIQKETKQWDDAAEQSTKNIDNSFSGMLKKIAAGFSAVKIGKALIDIGKDALQAASDLQEVQNVVETTFGREGTTKIETWAKTASAQFGLTETQAKKFTSTLGAMMKSSGIAGDEIVSMSTDLAGLAADMSSFYNLDFDTAFQKIRSGISGETEPLKQLGINMSTANLEAFALAQGLKKTWNQMTQGEQVMLRYQYLMSATADAQGDFAKTSDGFANSIRLIESNITSLQTKVGDVLIPIAEWITTSINSLFNGEEGTASKRRTVLDDLSDIDAKTQEALEKIRATKTHVEELTKDLEEIGNKNGAVDEAAGNITTAVEGVSSLASQLSKVRIEGGAKEAFERTLAILYNNVDLLSNIKGEDAKGVKDWLDGVAEEAKKLKPEDAQAWATLMSSLIGNIPGLENTDQGKNLIQQLTEYYLSLGTNSAEAAEGLSKLGYGTEDIEKMQSQWLATCKELVRTMPGLSEIIDTQTGEVKGGIPAIKAYADEWERMAKYEAQMQGLQEKKELVTGLPAQNDLENTVRSRQAEALAMLKAYGKLTEEEAKQVVAGAKAMVEAVFSGANFDDYGILSYDDLKNNWGLAASFFYGGEAFSSAPEFTGDLEKAKDALIALMEAEYDLQEFEEVQPELIAAYDQALEELAEEYGVNKEALDAEAKAALEAKKNMTLVEKAADGDATALEELTVKLADAKDAFAAMADYAEETRKKVENSINGVAKSLDGVDYQKYSDTYAKVLELGNKSSSLKIGSDEWKKNESELEKYNSQLVSTNKIYSNLESQNNFLTDYLNNLEKAQRMGLSNELLATLSDGSVESAQYLDALVNDKTGKTASQIDALFQEVQKKKQELTGALTDQQLTADQVYQGMAEAAKKAVEELDLGALAKENTGKTVGGIVQGIADNVDGVREAVDAIIAEINRLAGVGVSIDLGTGYSIPILTPSTSSMHPTGSRSQVSVAYNEKGLDRVPYDGYLSVLHEGESILTAEEARVWRNFKNGGSGVDYETMGGVMRDNIKPGGNVYLDGRIVGSVISEQQGRAYRQLKRSGWQS